MASGGSSWQVTQCSSAERLQLLDRVMTVLRSARQSSSQDDLDKMRHALGIFERQCFETSGSKEEWQRRLAARVVQVKEALEKLPDASGGSSDVSAGGGSAGSSFVSSEPVTVTYIPATQQAAPQQAPAPQPAVVVPSSVSSSVGAASPSRSMSPSPGPGLGDDAVALPKLRLEVPPEAEGAAAVAAVVENNPEFSARVAEEASGLSAWWPECNRGAAEELLKARTHKCFLLRPSTTANSVALSIFDPADGTAEHIQVIRDPAAESWRLENAVRDPTGRYTSLRNVVMQTPQLRGFDPIRNPKNQDLQAYSRARKEHNTVMYGGMAANTKPAVVVPKNVQKQHLPEDMLTVKDRMDMLTGAWLPDVVAAHGSDTSPGVARARDRTPPVATETTAAQTAAAERGAGLLLAAQRKHGDSSDRLDVLAEAERALAADKLAAERAAAAREAARRQGEFERAAAEKRAREEVAAQARAADAENQAQIASAGAAERSAAVDAAVALANEISGDTKAERGGSSALRLEEVIPAAPRSAPTTTISVKPAEPTKEKAFWDSDDFFADPEEELEKEKRERVEKAAEVLASEEESLAALQREMQERKDAEEKERIRLMTEAADQRDREQAALQAEAEAAAQQEILAQSQEKCVLLTGNPAEDQDALVRLRQEALDADPEETDGRFSTWIVLRIVIPEVQSATGSGSGFELAPPTGSQSKNIYVGARIRLSHTVMQLKNCLWRWIEDTPGVKPPREGKENCVFVVDDDDFLIDEGDKIDQQSYVLFSLANALVPQLTLADKRELQLMNMQVLSAVGKPLVSTVTQVENDHLRKQMNRIHYNKYILRSDDFEEYRVPSYLPEEYAVQVQFNEKVTKTISVTNFTTVGELVELIFTKFRDFLAKVLDRALELVAPDLFVLKFLGREDFLLNPYAVLSCNPHIGEALRQGQKISLVLLPRDAVLHNIMWMERSDYFAQRKFGDLDPESLEDVRSDGAFTVIHGNDIGECESTMRLKITRMDNAAAALAPAGFKNPQKNNVVVWATAGIFLASDPILDQESLAAYEADLRSSPLKRGQTVSSTPNGPCWYSVKTDECKYNGGNNPAWSGWIDTRVRYQDLPWASMLHVVLWAAPLKDRKKATCVGWANLRLTDYRDRVRQGFHGLLLHTNSSPNPQSNAQFFSAMINEKFDEETAPKVSVEIEVKDSPFFPTDTIYTLDDDLLRKLPSPSFGEFRDRLERLFETDPLHRLSTEEKVLLWQYRGWCFSEMPQKSIFKFCYSIPWADGSKVREFYSLLDNWPVLDEPQWSLELLQPRFLDRHIRSWVVRNLMQLTDSELSQVQLQLVQAVKHEIHNDSVLARFLLMRAWQNTTTIGHQMFWVMKTEAQQIDFSERFELLLECFVRGCGASFRNELVKETQLAESLVGVAKAVQAAPKGKRRAHLVSALDPNAAPTARKGSFRGPPPPVIKFPQNFLLPATPTVVANDLVIDECKSMESKTCPLWLVFKNLDPIGPKISSIFKVGDDLRQDQLTLQMMDIFDRMWLRAGLDLRTTIYPVVATGPDTGWIGVVHNARTCAEIQKATGAGALKAAFNERVLAEWLQKENPSDLRYEQAVDNFIRSCAASCVTTYILGIGDRHNDNIMLRTNGQLFHIDFGKFLGNAQMAMGVSRDRAPFVFTPDMAYVMGGTKSDNFAKFVDLCQRAYNIARENAHGVINLFAMMVATGIPELQSEDDLDYLREALALDLEPAAAAEKFKGLIESALGTTSTRLNFAVHLLANPD